jgi:hypothetical protein
MSLALFNYLEAVLWFLISASIFIGAFRAGRSAAGFPVLLVAGVAFLAFGVSDIIEVRTGAWWRPLWLLALKAACVVVLAGCYLRYRAVRRSGD